MSKTVIIVVSESSLPLARSVADDISSREHFSASERERDMPEPQNVVIYTKKEIGSYSKFLKDNWQELDAVIFIGALGICTRSIASALKNGFTVVTSDGNFEKYGVKTIC